MTDEEIATAMYAYGGSFVSALANAWERADSTNQARLKAAFPDLFAKYRELAELKRQQADEARR